MLGMLANMGSVPPITNGAGSPINAGSSATSGTGDQTQNIGFTGGSVNFGGGTNNQLLILAGVVLVGLYLFKKK